jgi:hypothetical protein
LPPTRETHRQSLIRQRHRLSRRITQLATRSSRLSWVRLWVFLLTLGVSFLLASVDSALAWAAFVLGIGLFIVSIVLHQRTEAALARFRIWDALKTDQLARQALDWDALPPPLADPLIPNHPFEFDLDISGENSLHRLLDTPATLDGSRRLRDWLLTTMPQPDVIERRRVLVQALVARPLFVSKLGLYGRLAGSSRTRWSAAPLHHWINEEAPRDGLGWVVAVLALLSAFTIPLGLANALGLLPPYWVMPFAIYVLISLTRLRTFFGLFEESSRLKDSLQPLNHVFTYLETAHYPTGSALATLCKPFTARLRPSSLLRRITFVVSASSLQRNVLLWLYLNAMVPWDLFFAWQLRRAKRDLRQDLPAWLDVWFELEALAALATFATLNPDYTQPVLQQSPVQFNAVGLGHPLIDHDKRIANNFTLNPLGEVALVTGSNMSGKSTFLRTVGVNMVLAYAGSVVVAQSLSLAYFRLFTTLRINDSLAEGISYFYAEVRRLKALLDALRQPDALPLFFLIDEIFRGTNNRERLIGSRAYIQALVGSGDTPQHGMGIVSTHDLELTSLAGERVHNYHFSDSVTDGRMTFDYRLKHGPSLTTNALRIMALEGLPVPDADHQPTEEGASS